jgi:two-component system chemotaxis response regulator CheB
VPRDIICIGASSGGVLALRRLLAELPAGLPASVFVVQHIGDAYGSELSRVIGADCAFKVQDALHGDAVEHGRVYVAPPDNHLQVREGHVDVVRAARENGHRPAVNPLFRSAAEAYGPRVIAAVLTGALDCGTTGLMVVKARGGVSVAEDPRTAAWPDMPASAIRAGVVDHVVPLEDIAALLIRLVSEESGAAMPDDKPSKLQAAPGYSYVTCPHCHGSLRESGGPGIAEFECHVGHKFSLRSLYSEQADQVEFAMWAAIRALEESASLAQRLAAATPGGVQGRFLDKERTMKLHAETLRAMVLSGAGSTRRDLASSDGS